MGGYMLHCQERMLRRSNPSGWFCVKCKRFFPDDIFDRDTSDKVTIATVIIVAIIFAGLIIAYKLILNATP